MIRWLRALIRRAVGAVARRIPGRRRPLVRAAETPPGGPNTAPADPLTFTLVDRDLAATVTLRRHGGGGYTAKDGGWYLTKRGHGHAYYVERQDRHGGHLYAERVAICPTLAACRTFIGAQTAATAAGEAMRERIAAQIAQHDRSAR